MLENIELIQNLEKTKQVTTEVSEKVALAKVTEERLNAVSEVYRPVARRGAALFFLLAQLFKIHSFYMFSMESFVAVINRAIDSISVVGCLSTVQAEPTARLVGNLTLGGRPPNESTL